MNLSK